MSFVISDELSDALEEQEVVFRSAARPFASS